MLYPKLYYFFLSFLFPTYTFVVGYSIKLSSNYPIWVCHLRIRQEKTINLGADWCAQSDVSFLPFLSHKFYTDYPFSGVSDGLKGTHQAFGLSRDLQPWFLNCTSLKNITLNNYSENFKMKTEECKDLFLKCLTLFNDNPGRNKTFHILWKYMPNTLPVWYILFCYRLRIKTLKEICAWFFIKQKQVNILEEVGNCSRFNWGRHTSVIAKLMVHVQPRLNALVGTQKGQCCTVKYELSEKLTG